MRTSDIIAEVSNPLMGLPVYLAGSLVAEETYQMTDVHDDADIFCSTEQVLFASIERYLSAGFQLEERFVRVYERWLRYGFKRWHTNSIKLVSPSGNEVNLIFKLQDGHPTTSLAQVLESFDFGLLAVGYDLEFGTRRDMRPYLFPEYAADGPYPLMPNKRINWRSGFISKYNGIRESGRYAKYAHYGYDLSLVKDDLVTGYYAAAAYHASTGKEDNAKLATIYETTAILIEDDEIEKLRDAAKTIVYLDSLDAIMEALE